MVRRRMRANTRAMVPATAAVNRHSTTQNHPRVRDEILRTYLTVNKTQSYSAFVDTATSGYVWAPASTSLSFEISDSSDFNNFSGLYDQFRVTGVDVEFSWLKSTSDANMTQLMVVSDPDGGVIPSNYDAFTQYKRIWRFSLPLFEGFVKRIPNMKCMTKGAAGNLFPPTQWFDCADATNNTFIVGYTSQIKRTTSPSGLTDKLQVQFRPHLEFRHRR